MSEVQPIEYRPIKGFPGYRVGDDGSVWTRWKKIPLHRRDGLGRIFGQGSKWVLSKVWKRRKPAKDKHGRRNVVLARPGQKAACRLVSRLVLETFVGPRPKGMETCHDPDPHPANNRLENLRWDTKKANMADCIRHGRMSRGEARHNARFTEAQVLAIRDEHAAGKSMYRIAKEHEVSYMTIHKIIRRVTWTHLP